MTETINKRGSWFRFKLRTLLIVVTLCGFVFSGIQFFLVRSRTQRSAMAGLNQCGLSAIERLGGTNCMPGFSFDSRSPAFLEDIGIGSAYFGRVTDVCFRSSDDKQVMESLPHLKQLDHLGRVMFMNIPDDSVVNKYRELLPNVKLVDGKGAPLL